MAAGLQDMGVRRGISAGIFMPNCPQVMRGYLNQMKKNQKVLRGRVLHTGDLGYVDEERFPSPLLARRKNILVEEENKKENMTIS